METKKRVPTKRKPPKKPLSQKAILMYGVGGGLVLGLGYLAYSFFRNRAAQKRSISPPVSTITPNPIVTRPVLPIASNNQFPIKKGSRGSLVRFLQNALLAKGGKPAMIIRETSFRRGKVDGIFGNGTQRALRAAGYPSAISQSLFTSIVGKQKASGVFDAGSIAKELIDAANKRNLFGVLKGLQHIKTVQQYRQVSLFFQNVRILGTRVSSLVNALLSVAFKNKELEKVKIRAEFRRMGLKQNARGVWFIPNLSGIESFDNDQERISQEWNLAIAEKPTLLKASDGTFIVPELAPNTVIGYITGIQNGMTRILTQSGETVYAPTHNLSSM